MNILTFDIEDWYNFLEHEPVDNPIKWKNYPNRIEYSVNKILNILDEYNLKASFFVLGWIAEKNPQIIKEISKRGFEVGIHSYSHNLIFNQSWNEFKEDIDKSKKIIEDIIGISPESYRAPGFSIMESTTWAFEILAEMGIKNDSSIFPTNRNHGGFRRFPFKVPCSIETTNTLIREFPINTITFLGENVVFSGGGYFRLTPYFLIKFFTKKSHYLMSYFHPSDLDKDKPIMKSLPLIRKFRAYYGIKSCEFKLRKWITDFNFIDLRTALKIIDWTKAPVVKL